MAYSARLRGVGLVAAGFGFPGSQGRQRGVRERFQPIEHLARPGLVGTLGNVSCQRERGATGVGVARLEGLGDEAVQGLGRRLLECFEVTGDQGRVDPVGTVARQIDAVLVLGAGKLGPQAFKLAAGPFLGGIIAGLGGVVVERKEAVDRRRRLAARQRPHVGTAFELARPRHDLLLDQGLTQQPVRLALQGVERGVLAGRLAGVRDLHEPLEEQAGGWTVARERARRPWRSSAAASAARPRATFTVNSPR